MNYASPAPQVEAAVAATAPLADPAIAAPATEVGAAVLEADSIGTTTPATTTTTATTPQLTVDMLRAQGSVVFESEVGILPGAPPKNFLKRWLPWFFDERDFVTYREIKKYCVILSLSSKEAKKDTTIYVYASVSDPSPLYTLSVDENCTAFIEDRTRPDRSSVTVSPLPDTNLAPLHFVTVLLQTANHRSKRRTIHQFTLDTTNDSSLPERLCACLEPNAKGEGQLANEDGGKSFKV